MNCIWKAISTFCLYPSYQLLTDLTTLIFRRITEDNFFRTDESLSLIWLMQFLAQKMKDWHITIILNQSNTLYLPWPLKLWWHTGSKSSETLQKFLFYQVSLKYVGKDISYFFLYNSLCFFIKKQTSFLMSHQRRSKYMFDVIY